MNSSLSPRQRMCRALERRGDSYPLLDLGSSPNTTMTRAAHERLLEFLGLSVPSVPRWMNLMFQSVFVEERALEALHIDTRPVVPDPVQALGLRWLHGGMLADAWGITYKPAQIAGKTAYYEVLAHPLQSVSAVEDLDGHAWPSVEDSSPWEDLERSAARLHHETQFALVGHPGDTSLLETAWSLLGAERFMMALVKEKALIHAVMERVLAIQSRRMEHFLSRVGSFLDVVCVGDDLGHQGGLLMSPTMYRQMIRPYHRRFFALIKSKTQAKLHLHSCGAIQSLLPDLLELGVDVINPVQVSAKGMAPEELSVQFGDRMAFWGGIDTQGVLRSGSPAEVREEVRRAMGTLGRHGGYVLGAVHNIQADVPPENVSAMYDEAWRQRMSTQGEENAT